MKKLSNLLILAMLLAASVASAHHSLNAEFDTTHTTSWTGRVVNIDWANPHVYVNVAVTDKTGKVEQWRFQGNPHHVLQRDGVTRGLITPGTTVNIHGLLAKNKNLSAALPRSGYAREIELPGGQRFHFGSK
jgi:hypothetical protein